MKRRLVQALLLSAMMVSLSAYVAPVRGKEHNEITGNNAEETEKIVLNLPEVTIEKTVNQTVNQSNYILSDHAKENPTEVAINEMQEDFKVLENISDRREWFITYKSIISKYSEYIDQPENIYDYFTQAEINMFFKVVQAEIGDEYTFEQKCNVASVILNRLYSDEFENEMFKILTPSQFETIANGRYKKVQVSEDTILACEYVFMFGDTTNGALFFDSNNALKYNKISSDGAHNFYK